MCGDFDPYERWLKIPPDDQPANHYRLLGLELFESDVDLIEAAVENRVAFLQDVATGPRVKQSQKLLNEIAAARICLMDPERKAVYDAELRHPVPAVVQAPPQAPPTAWQTPPTIVDSTAQGRRFQRSGTTGKKGAVKAGESETKSAPTDKPPTYLIALSAVAVIVAAIFLGLMFGSKEIPPNSEAVEPSKVMSVVADARPKESPSNRQAPLAVPIPTEGLVLWLDAADDELFTEDTSGGVALWKDRSGTGADAQQADPDHRPRRLSTAAPTIHFSGKQFLTVKNVAQFNFGSTYSIIYVAAGEKGVLMCKGQPSNKNYQGNSFSTYNSVTSFRVGRSDYFRAKTDNPQRLNVRSLVADESAVRRFVGGRADGVFERPHRVDNDKPLLIGRRVPKNSPAYFQGTLGEVIIYKRALSAEDRTKVEAYLRAKWRKTMLRGNASNATNK